MRPFAFLALLATVATFVWVSIRPQSNADVTVFSQGPSITQLERLGQLVTTKVHVADVLTAQGAGYRGAWLIKGDALIAVDLTKARIPGESKDLVARRAQVLLPLPRVVQARVDHRRSRTWDVEKTTWVPFGGDPDKLRDSAMAQAQGLVERAANSDGAIEQAQELTQSLIGGMYRMVDWEVEVCWSE